MASVETRSFDSPDETRTPEKTRVDVVKFGDTTVGRFTFQPGWRWSECVKPVAGTESCQVHHVGYVVQGTLHVRHDDGTEGTAGPGEVYHIHPGHEGWVEGDEEFIGIEFSGAAGFAKK